MLALLLLLALQPPEPAARGAPPTGAGAPAAREELPAARARAVTPAADERPILRGFERRSGRRFSADLEDVDVSVALRDIAEAADWSIVLPGGRHGTISARFKEVPVEDALRAVLTQAGLTATREGALVTVYAPLPSRVEPEDARDGGRAEERAAREADREARRLERELDGGGSDRVVHGDVVVHRGERARDVVALRGSVKLEPGAEVRDAVAVLGSIVLEPGAVARQAVAVGGNVRLGPGAGLDRDAVSIGGEVVRDASATIGGETVSVGIPALSGLAGLAGSRMLFGRAESPVFVVGQVLAKFVVYFAVGLLVLALFPRRLDVVAASFTAHPWKSILTGLLGVVVLPLLLVVLVATVIGIPLVAVAGLLVVAAGVLGFSALAYHVGRALPLRPGGRTAVVQLALGTAAVVLVTAIPLLGGMAWIAAALLTFGAVLRSRFGSQSPPLPATVAPPGPPPPAAIP